ncbi:MAG: hypothetical protein CMJ23_05030 [Phycisphaerae bacterium]|nr:hypothetical protein [Phycisphaerae bacterium]
MHSPRSFLAAATIIVGVAASSSHATIAEGSATERKTLMSFSGGGIYAHSVHTSLIRGMLSPSFPSKADDYAPTSGDLEALFSRTHTITANSGGTWLMTQLAYSPEFENALLLHANRVGWNSPDGYLGQMTRFPEVIFPDLSWPYDEVSDLLNEFVPDLIRFRAFDNDWARVNREWVFGPFEMGTNITATVQRSGDRNAWADGINLIWAAGLPAHVAGAHRLGSSAAEAMLYDLVNSAQGWNYLPGTRMDPNSQGWLTWTYPLFPYDQPYVGEASFEPSFGSIPITFNWSADFENWFASDVAQDALSHPFEPLTIGSPAQDAANDHAQFFARDRRFHYSILRRGVPAASSTVIPADVDYRSLSVIDAAAISSSAVGPFASDGIFTQSLWANAGNLCQIAGLGQLCGNEVRDLIMTDIFPADKMDINLEINDSNELSVTPNADLERFTDMPQLAERRIFSGVDGVWVDDLGVAHMIRDLGLRPEGLSASLDALAQDIDYGGYASNNPQLVIFEASTDIVVAERSGGDVFLPKNTAKLFGITDRFTGEKPHTNSGIPTSDTHIFNFHESNPFPLNVAPDADPNVAFIVNSVFAEDRDRDHYYIINTFFCQAALKKNSLYGITGADAGTAIDVTVVQVQFVDAANDDLHQSMSGVLLPLTSEEFEYLGNMTTAVAGGIMERQPFIFQSVCPSRNDTEWRDYLDQPFFAGNGHSAFELLQRALGECPPGSPNLVDPGCGCACVPDDSDNDGVPDHLDVCPGFPDDGPDVDEDGIPDVCDDAVEVTYDPVSDGDLGIFLESFTGNASHERVSIPEGTYLIDDTISIDSMTISGAGGGAVIKMRDDAAPARVFNAQFLNLSNLQIEGGQAPGGYGGAIRLRGSIVLPAAYGTFKNVTFVDNSAFYGGAVSIESNLLAATAFAGCRFLDNHAMFGGGAYHHSGLPADSARFENCEFVGNSSDLLGGAISYSGGFLTLADSSINSNTAATGGGGIQIGGNSYVSIENCKINSNLLGSPGLPGGAISAVTPTETFAIITLTDTVICGNTAPAGDPNLQVFASPDCTDVPDCTGTSLFTAGSTCLSSSCLLDGNGVADRCDLCPDDAFKTEPGVCGCGVPDVDTDGDGLVDCLDDCPDDPSKFFAGLCGCGVSDLDSDFDGVPDCDDTCPDSLDWLDSDGDGIADGCDPDTVFHIGPTTDFQAALAYVSPGQTLLLEPGVYYTALDVDVPGLSIIGTGTPENPTILIGPDGSADPVIRISTAAGSDPVLLENIMISGEKSGSAAGLVVAQGDVEFRESLVFACTSDLGGVVVNAGGTLSMFDCQVFGNTATTPEGGGIFVQGDPTPGTLQLVRTTVCENLPVQLVGPATIDEDSCVAADCTDSDESGVPDECEVCIGDINGDGNVDAADLGLLIGAWDTSDAAADANADGNVDAADLGLLIGAWGACP